MDVKYASELAVYAREWLAADLGLTDAICNMKATANTIYWSGFIDISTFNRFVVLFTATTSTIGTAGTAAIIASFYAEDKATLLWPAEQNIVTALDTKPAAATVGSAVWGWNVTGVAFGGTIGTSINAFQGARYMKLGVKVTQANNTAGTSTGSVILETTR